MKKQRYLYLDNVCAVLILHMIFVCHQTMFCNYSNIVLGSLKKILGFFMAWFFFKGGMMFKAVELRKVARSSSKRLLFPYAIFTVLGLAIMALEENVVNGNNPVTLGFLKNEVLLFFKWSTLFPTMACWFLLSLFVVRIVFALAYKKNTPPFVCCPHLSFWGI